MRQRTIVSGAFASIAVLLAAGASVAPRAWRCLLGSAPDQGPAGASGGVSGGVPSGGSRDARHGGSAGVPSSGFGDGGGGGFGDVGGVASDGGPADVANDKYDGVPPGDPDSAFAEEANAALRQQLRSRIDDLEARPIEQLLGPLDPDLVVDAAMMSTEATAAARARLRQKAAAASRQFRS